MLSVNAGLDLGDVGVDALEQVIDSVASILQAADKTIPERPAVVVHRLLATQPVRDVTQQLRRLAGGHRAHIEQQAVTQGVFDLADHGIGLFLFTAKAREQPFTCGFFQAFEFSCQL